MPQKNTANLQHFLDRLNLRSVLYADEQQAVLDLPSYTAQVTANHDHVALDEVTEHATLIVSGMLGRFGQNANGDRQITALHIAGDMANLQSVVEPRATSALQAMCTSTILRIPHDALRAMTGRHPALSEALWRDCMVDAGVLSQWVVNVGRRNATCRIAHLLCETATRYRALGEGHAMRFEFPLTQSQIADATGITSVHVNRTLKALGDVVRVTRNTVQILDWDGLVRKGEFDADYLQANVKLAQRMRIAAMA